MPRKYLDPRLFWMVGLLYIIGCSDAVDPESRHDHSDNEETAMTTAPYGTWASPVSAELAAGSNTRLAGLQLDGDDLYWLEIRPLEGGRSVLVRRTADGSEDVTPADFNVRTRVHEYGGTAFVVAKGVVYFSNFADQALYRQEAGKTPVRITGSDGLRYADCAMDAHRNRLICVREDHRQTEAGSEAINGIAAVSLNDDTDDGVVLWQESDFVGYPRISPDGRQLAWISWNHPNMPWDNVALWVAEFGPDGSLTDARRLNADVDESVLQPEWAADGTLYFLADRSGFWNLHRFDGEAVSPVHEVAADIGSALWGLGSRWYALLGDNEAAVEVSGADGTYLARVDLRSGAMTAIDLPYVNYGAPNHHDDQLYFLGGRSTGLEELVQFDLQDQSTSIIHRAGEDPVPPEYLSIGEPITFPTTGGDVAYAYYYPPTNADFEAPENTLPPLMVLMHGGPTSATSPTFSIAKQFWTTRGFAVVDVNYRGSTGYGRAFRQKLNGQWGVVDLEDAVAVTRHLVQQGKADPERLLIRGGSAGGYTTLSALAFTDVFAAGANYFGVSDLTALAKHTHKFESRYLDSMVGPYPEAAEVYTARSPINALEGFDAPLITFQGLEDRVVPPEQSEKIYAALKARGTPTAYLPFEGEQHGFRKAENNIRALQSELYFYGTVLGFTPAGDLPTVPIENLPD